MTIKRTDSKLFKIRILSCWLFSDSANSLDNGEVKPPSTIINPAIITVKLIIEKTFKAQKLIYNGINKKADNILQNLPMRLAIIFFSLNVF